MTDHQRSIAKAIAELQIAAQTPPMFAEAVLIAAVQHTREALNDVRRIIYVGNRRASDVPADAPGDVGHGR